MKFYLWVMVDDLKYLECGGWIFKIVVVFGGLMNIKLIICVDVVGKLVFVGKICG